ncbi:MAG: hypothetical protein JWO84_601 [Parcubacteria group bacterium]|nr:hypothetical protein [Parcubacteria group bacterium]
MSDRMSRNGTTGISPAHVLVLIGLMLLLVYAAAPYAREALVWLWASFREWLTGMLALVNREVTHHVSPNP